jgi:hypothetical protein
VLSFNIIRIVDETIAIDMENPIDFILPKAGADSI